MIFRLSVSMIELDCTRIPHRSKKLSRLLNCGCVVSAKYSRVFSSFSERNRSSRSSTCSSGSLMGAIHSRTSTSSPISSTAGLMVVTAKLLLCSSWVKPSIVCSPCPLSSATWICSVEVTFRMAEVIACSALEEVM